jgi:hypothetical protein
VVIRIAVPARRRTIGPAVLSQHAGASQATQCGHQQGAYGRSHRKLLERMERPKAPSNSAYSS